MDTEHKMIGILSTLTQLIVGTLQAESTESKQDDSPEAVMDAIARAFERETDSFTVDAENQSLLRFVCVHACMRVCVCLCIGKGLPPPFPHQFMHTDLTMLALLQD